jgi:hypothetical protein
MCIAGVALLSDAPHREKIMQAQRPGVRPTDLVLPNERFTDGSGTTAVASTSDHLTEFQIGSFA